MLFINTIGVALIALIIWWFWLSSDAGILKPNKKTDNKRDKS